jgi:hypothetical protein
MPSADEFHEGRIIQSTPMQKGTRELACALLCEA